MKSQDLARKIQDKLNAAGVSPERIELERAVQKGDPAAQYKKACVLLGRSDCRLTAQASKHSSDLRLKDRLEAGWSVSGKVEAEGEWFHLLRSAADSGYDQALTDMLHLIHWPPYIQDPQTVFRYYILAAEDAQFTYVDEYGEPQPYALLVGEIYWRGRVFHPTALDVAEMKYHNDHTGVSLYDARCDSRDGSGLPLRSSNKINADPSRAIAYLEAAVQKGSKAAMSRLQASFSRAESPRGMILSDRIRKPVLISICSLKHVADIARLDTSMIAAVK
jgi:TPR repeat protein